MGVTSDAIGSEKKERDVGDTVDEVVVREGEELSLSLGAKTSTRLKQAKEGLIRIQDDTFGACKKCLKPISLARLNAIPESPHCVKCSDEK